ncbi:MAG: hypothetical protein JJ902_05170 [Roseibium sp.]|nr:hypothetical protein [Roseibium sp.]
MSEFKFDLKATVMLTVSGEVGKVVGRAQYTNSADQYFIRYQTADLRAVESWWSEDALQKVDVPSAA